jgi:sulfite exporter TauE/SafE
VIPDAELAVFLLVGLLGGAHCLGMCGPLVTLYADRLEEGRADGGTASAGHDRPGAARVDWPTVRQHLLFNLGRAGAYALVGLLLGAVGAVVVDAAAVVQVADVVRAVVGVAVGAFVVATGASYLLRGRPLGGHDLGGTDVGAGVFRRVHGAITSRVDRWVRGPRMVGLGALHAALPCPLLYPAYLYVLARGRPVRGAVLLGALGLGTVPTLLAYGTLLGSLGPETRARLHRALGAAFIALGYLPLAMGLHAVGVAVPMPPVPYYQPLG